MRSRLGCALAVGLGAVLLAVPVAQADWKNDYDRGIKAVEAGQWSEAERLFGSALREEPEPAALKRFQGVVRKRYVPHYYAGLAAYRQGNCQRALDYWGNAGSAAIVSGQADISGVQRSGIADCNQKIAAVSKPVDPTPPVVTTPTPPIATPSKPPITAPAKPVVVAPPPSKPVVEPVKPPVVTPSSTPAPAALVGALDSFLAGRYAAVVQLDPNALADGRAKAQGFLLRAASRYTLAELADSDSKQLDQARQDILAARKANASLSPDETLFSPRFRAFWKLAR